MHAHIAIAAPADRFQHGRGAARPGLVLREDVVELVAAAAQAPDVRPLAVAVLDLGLGGRLVVVVVIVLGEAEVDEGAMPGIAESH